MRVLAGVAAAAAIVGGAAYLKWAVTRPPVVADGRVYPKPNGYEACRAATAKMALIDTEADVWKDGHEAEQRRLLAEYAADIQALRQAVRLEYMNPPALDIHDDYAFLKGPRIGARLLAVRAREAMEQGRTGEAMSASVDAIELGTRLGRGGSIFPNLAGMACCSIGGRELEACVPSLSPQQVSAARARLEGLDRRLPEAVDVVPEVRREWFGTLESLFEYGLDPSRAERDSSSWSQGLPPPLVWRLYPKPWVYSESEAYFRAVEVELRKPHRERRAVASPREFISGSLLTWIEFEVWAKALAVGVARLRLQVVDLAVREHRARFGRYPASLGELNLKLGPETLKDPFGDGRFLYRRKGDSFLLYSMGPDGKDDGGRPLLQKDISQGRTGDLVAGRLYKMRRMPSNLPHPIARNESRSR